METELTFNDVLVLPRYSEIKSRGDINLETNLCSKIKLKNPIISSPMDTVTEDEMAIELALNGGLGIIHRFQSIESQIEMVHKVKRYLSPIIPNPYTIHYKSTIEELIELCKEKGVTGGIIMIDDKGYIKDIICKRDIEYNKYYGKEKYICDMKKDSNLVYIRKDNKTTDELVAEAITIYQTYKISKVPIIENMKPVGLFTWRNVKMYKLKEKMISLDSKNRLLVGAAIGLNDFKRIEMLIRAEVDIVCVDVASGHNKHIGDYVKKIKELYPDLLVMSGNVCTYEGFKYLAECGSDCIRVGIGNGSICSTRLVSGCGRPQLSSLLDCRRASEETGVGMISDGGHLGLIGNKFKALCAGSNVVMLGKSLACCLEAPGIIINRNGKKMKYYRGMASDMASKSRNEKQNREDNKNRIAEGVDGFIPVKGKVREVVKELCGGMKSGMSYVGCKTIDALHKNPPRFSRLTNSGIKETQTRV